MVPARHTTGHDYTIYYRAFHDETPAHVRCQIDSQKEHLARILPDVRIERALDIGCGMGFAVQAMRELGYGTVEGIDVDPGQIEASQRLGAGGVLVTDTIEFLRVRPNTYQLITMLDVLEHVPVADQINTLRAVYSALTPGGRFIVQVPNATFVLASRWRYGDYTHHSSFTDHSLNYVVRNSGFEKVEILPSQKIYRPSFKGLLFNRSERKAFRSRFRRWLVRWCWEQVIRAELPFENVQQLCLDPNLTAIATKNGAV